MSDEFYVFSVEDVSGPHTPALPFCDDPNCPCHFDSELTVELIEQVNDGLLTGAEATRLFDGRQL